MKVKLLVGSGISIRAGMPNCKDIGSVLRNGHSFGLEKESEKKYANHYIRKHTNQEYYLVEETAPFDIYENYLTELDKIKDLYKFIENNLVSQGYNYEDIIDIMAIVGSQDLNEKL